MIALHALGNGLFRAQFTAIESETARINQQIPSTQTKRTRNVAKNRYADALVCKLIAERSYPHTIA